MYTRCLQHCNSLSVWLKSVVTTQVYFFLQSCCEAAPTTRKWSDRLWKVWYFSSASEMLTPSHSHPTV